jgi:LmbE family N-acetylglucosaminyl deacetylase
MLNLKAFWKIPMPKILCLGAHPDDLEIGCGGTILRIIDEVPEATFSWIVFSGTESRRKEGLKSADMFLNKTDNKRIIFEEFRDSYFPFMGDRIKDYFEKLKKEFSPDIILTHYSKDAHQDHSLISKLTWNTFRNHLILEYEIPKYDGDLGIPNLYVSLSESYVLRKLEILNDAFKTQKEKRWFDDDVFRSLLRLRGAECNSQSRFAEGYYCKKIVL